MLLTLVVICFHPIEARNLAQQNRITGLYALAADDTVPHYGTAANWTPVLHSYQKTGFNTLFLTFVRPDTMDVPLSFGNFTKQRPNLPPDTRIIFAIGGIEYSTQINPWPWLESPEAARAMAQKVAAWQALYDCDGIDLDIEDGAGNARDAGQNLVIFVRELKRLKPNFLVTVPVYGYPQIQATNDLVNAAFGPDGHDYGLVDAVSIMVYEGVQALDYIGNYAKIPGKSRWEGFPIQADVPRRKLLVGLKGSSDANTIQNMSQGVLQWALGGYVVWYGSLLNQGKTGLQYQSSWDASVVQSSQWEQSRETLEKLLEPCPGT